MTRPLEPRPRNQAAVTAFDWKVRPTATPGRAVPSLAAQLGVSPLLVRLLQQRGLDGLQAMDMFLSPGLRHLPPLSAWHGLEEAADCLAAEFARGRRLVIWGDYDVDGLTSSALLIDFFASRGIEVDCHIPDRLEEGYGLNRTGVERLAAAGAQVLLTVDCGISSHQEVARARELGMTVVVTDHHLPPEELPPAQAVVNPRIGGCPSPDLAGVGVAFLLAAALNSRLPGEAVDIRRHLDLVALGTVADVVRLTHINRILVKNGLLLLTEAKRPGIFALKEASGLPASAPMGSGSVAFSLAPRINAAGRLGNPRLALDLLLAREHTQARGLAKELDALNAARRKQEEGILVAALEQAREQEHRAGLVLYDPDWHQGVIGIVASRVVEAFNRPVLILCRDKDGLKGSGRSIPAFDLFAGLTECAPLLSGFGGHPQAAGLRLEECALDDLRLEFDRVVTSRLGETPPRPCLTLDAELGFADIDHCLLKELELLQPFGLGNPKPLFASPPVHVTTRRVFKGKHVSLALKEPGSNITLWGKAWRQAKTLGPSIQGKTARFAYTPRLNHYNGLTSIDLDIKDWKEE